MQDVINNLSIVAENIQIVSFNVGLEEFAVDIKYIQEIIKVPPITFVPLTKNYVEGVINIRGSIIPVVNLRLKMNFQHKDFSSSNRIIVLSFENRKAGLIVDNMNQVIRITSDQINPPPIKSEDGNDRFAESVYILDERIITILDVNTLLDTK